MGMRSEGWMRYIGCVTLDAVRRLGSPAVARYWGEEAMKRGKKLPFKLDLIPGWNLISFPGTPVKPAVADVFPPSLGVEVILTYQNAYWLTCVLEEDRWEGELTEVTGGYGYWAKASVPQTIETLIAEVKPDAPLPMVDAIAGWNLIGVLDVEQHAAGEAPGEPGCGGSDADRYFSSLDWKVAYSLDTPPGEWTRILPGKNGEGVIANGRAYWVWVENAGVLSPCGLSETATAQLLTPHQRAS